MLDTLFEFLFKYPRIAYEEGQIVLASPWGVRTVLLLLAGGLVLVGVGYLRAPAGGRVRWIPALIRAAGLAILALCLLRPTLVLSTVVPQQNLVAILIDDSRSMAIADLEGRTRGAVARELFADQASSLLGELSERFVVRHYGFAGEPSRIRSAEELTFQGSRTRIGPALDRVRQELTSLPLSAVVLVSDGGDQAPEALQDALLALRAEGIPVHTVGMGLERLEPDVEIERVQLPSSALRGSTVVAEVVVAHRGLDGRTVPVRIMEGGRILASEEVELPRRGGSATVRLPLDFDGAGVRSLRVSVPVQPGELVEDNNHRDVHIRVRDQAEKILYFEGEPRHEVGFFRRAIRGDEDLQVVVLQRTGDDRYLRLDVDDPDQLANGFPRTREELFEYRALILGSVEANHFTADQLRMIRDFVDRRGGSLLMLGGWRALGEGGYAGTPLAPVLPLEFDGSPPPPAAERLVELRIAPTPRGETHPVALVGIDEGLGENVEPADNGRTRTTWELLPALTTVNRAGIPRPGATVVLGGDETEGPGSGYPVLSYQRYGAGLSAVLAVHDTWIWQMHHEIALEDDTHETFWRQLLRWMVQEIPDPVQVTVARDRVAPDEPVEISVRVVDETFLPRNDARVVATVTDPFGADREVPLAWSVERDGEYRGSFVPAADGPHEIRVTSAVGDEIGTAPLVHVEAGVMDLELASGAMRGDLLRSIAEETGGRYFTPARTGDLAEALRYSERGTVVQESRDLWDLPFFLLLLVGLFSAEWIVRRRRGMP